jgi:hypothetical protein
MRITKPHLILALGLLSGLALAACNQAKSPDQVAKDTSAAQQSAAESTAKAEQKADDKMSSAQSDVNGEKKDAAHVDAVQSLNVAETKADGDHKVALAQCESLSGDAQKSCKDQADAVYKTAKAQAQQAKAAADPKP